MKDMKDKRKKKKQEKANIGYIIRNIITFIAVLNLVLLFVFDYKVPGLTQVMNRLGNSRNQAEGAAEGNTSVAVEGSIVFEFDDNTLVYDGKGVFDPMAGVTVKKITGEELSMENVTAQITGENAKEIVYTYADASGETYTDSRVLKLEEYSGPVIVLEGDLPVIYDDSMGQLPQLFKAHYSATDGYGKDISKQVKIGLEPTEKYNGIFKVVFTVTNQFGDTAVSEGSVLSDFQEPHLRMTNENVNIIVGQEFNPMDYVKYAVDWSGKNLIDRVEVTGEVDTNTAGDYTLEYDLMNEDEQSVKTKILKVHVIKE